MASHALVATGTKSLSAFASKYNNAYVGSFAANFHCIYHLLHRKRSKCIMHLRSVNTDLCYAFMLSKKYLFILLNSFPLSYFHFYFLRNLKYPNNTSALILFGVNISKITGFPLCGL